MVPHDKFPRHQKMIILLENNLRYIYVTERTRFDLYAMLCTDSIIHNSSQARLTQCSSVIFADNTPCVKCL